MMGSMMGRRILTFFAVIAIVKMRNSIEPKIYVRKYGFLSFSKYFGTHAANVTKNMSNKYSQKCLDSAKKSTTGAIKTASK